MAQSPSGGNVKDESRPETRGRDTRLPDPGEVGRAMAGIAERSQRLVTEWMSRQTAAQGQPQPANPDPFGVGSAFLDMTSRLMANPAGLLQAQIGLWNDYMTLWQTTAQRMMGADGRARDRGRPAETSGSATTRGATTRCSTSSASRICCRPASCRTWSAASTASIRTPREKSTSSPASSSTR